jgi:hypothetical protein
MSDVHEPDHFYSVLVAKVAEYNLRRQPFSADGSGDGGAGGDGGDGGDDVGGGGGDLDGGLPPLPMPEVNRNRRG